MTTSLETKPNKTPLLIIFVTVFIDLLGFGMVLPLLPIYAKAFEIKQEGMVIGLLMASFSAMTFASIPFDVTLAAFCTWKDTATGLTTGPGNCRTW